MTQAYLINTKDNHRKFYVVELLKEAGKFIVKGTWGRLGYNGSTQIKYFGEDAIRAEQEFKEVLKVRFNHGYELIKSK